MPASTHFYPINHPNFLADNTNMLIDKQDMHFDIKEESAYYDKMADILGT
jgi:hypothetical protein